MCGIEKDFTYIGYPCFSKIANQLNNAAEIPEYTAFALSVLKTDNIPNAELLVAAQESNLLPDSPIKNTDFLCYKEGVTEENVFDTLMKEARIKKHRDCTKYYKRFDSKMSLCRLCTRSPYYRNRYVNEEYSLLKFILSGRDNMQYLKELLKKYPTFRFMVSEDLAVEYRTKNTYVYESNAIFFECLKKHEDILYYSYNNYTIILKTSFSKMVKEGRRLPNTISQKDNWSLVAMDKILKRIDNAKDYSREEVEQFLIRWCEEEKNRKARIEEYESRLRDSMTAGISTAIKDFSPKIKKAKTAGQKKTDLKTESSDKSSTKQEKTDTQPFDPRNFVKFPDDIYNNIDTEEKNTPTECDNLSAGKLEIPQTSNGKNNIDSIKADSTERITNPIPEQIAEGNVTEEKSITSKKRGMDNTAVTSEVTDEVNSTEENCITLEESKKTKNNKNAIPVSDTEESEIEEYSDEDLLFQMYDSNIDIFYNEPEEYEYNCDYNVTYEEAQTDTEHATIDSKEKTDKKSILSDKEQTTPGEPSDADIKNTTGETGTNNDTSLAITKTHCMAAVVPYKKKIYPDMEELDDTLPYREITSPPIERQLNLEPVITEELLEQCIPLKEDLILLAEIETAILKERYFCVELVKDIKGNELFLFYIHKLHRYYYTRLDLKKVREVFLPLFKMPSVKKYCYLPYYIYGYCACREIKIRSLESIYATQSNSKEDNLLSLGDLCVKYMPYGQQALKKALENASPDQWFYGIAYYRTIISKIKTDEKKLRDTDALNEVFGNSYIAKRCFYTEDRLFILNTDGTLTFQNELYVNWLKKVRIPGYSVRYTVSTDKQTQKESIYGLLILLSSKGYVKNRTIQLIAVSDTTACFYIGKEDFAYLDTIIQTFLFQFGRTIEEYHTDISYEYHTPQ